MENITNITVSTLPSITFYSGEDSYNCGLNLENRNYGYHSNIFGDLSMTNDYNSYWSYMSNNIFVESPVNYDNIGDVIDATISYLNKFKNNNINISIDKNILTFNYDYDKDLDSNYDNTKIIPANDILNLLLNVNEMTFNKRHYYRNNIELSQITYAHKKYPYHGKNTKYTVHEGNTLVEYDFSNQFVDFNYTELSYEVSYIGYIVNHIKLPDGSYIDQQTDFSYEGFYINYTYLISDINNFSDRMNNYFIDNSNRVENEYNDLKTYFINELDTMITLTLNTYSVGNKNIYTYFNFDSKYSNWFNNAITFDTSFEASTSDIKEYTLAKITPSDESFFNVIIDEHNLVCGKDIQISSAYSFKINTDYNIENLPSHTKFKIINPSHIKSLDFTDIYDKIDSLNLINNYNKKVNASSYITSNWIKETDNINLESLLIGTNDYSTIRHIYGINNMTSLKELNLKNCQYINNINISKLSYLKNIELAGTQISTFVPHKENEFENISLPETLTTLILDKNQIDNFNYVPTSKLINLILDNVKITNFNVDENLNIHNTKDFINYWITQLDTHTIDGHNLSEGTISVLKSGIVQNTKLLEIDFENEPVDMLLKFKYLGINKNNFNTKLQGTISIKGSEETNKLNRKEYLDLIDYFGIDMTQTAGNRIKNDYNNLTLEYTFDTSLLENQLYCMYPIIVENESVEIPYTNNGKEGLIQKITVNDSVVGHSLLDYIETNLEATTLVNKQIYIDTDNSSNNVILNGNYKVLTFTKRNDNIGYELDLNNYNLNIDTTYDILTNQIESGDILLYKRNKIILSTFTGKTKYKYTKVGKFSITGFSNNPTKIDLIFIK